MKKSILFVDDEPMILQGLQRMLRPLRHEWDMDFVESGGLALQRMEQKNYDVIVSDMRMPGMNGAELLNQVMTLHPKTIRLILSGQSEHELILKCVGSTHQYLAKPCEPEALKATIARATSFQFTCDNERVQALVPRLERLPSLPSIYMELTRLLESPDVSMEEVGALIGRDIGLTARLLKIVNSGFFGLRRELTTPVEAASYLGVEIIKALMLGIHVYNEFKAELGPRFSAERLWQHSLKVGAAAERVAKAEGAGKDVSSQALTAGILHDAGKAVLAANLPGEYSAALRQVQSGEVSELDAERQAFGATHAEVGGYLLGLWGLPVPVVEAIAFHHAPSGSPAEGFTPLTAVHVANAFAGTDGPAGNHSPDVDEDYLKKTGVENRVAAWKNLVEGKEAAIAA